MLSETYFARFLWTARQEDASSCADRLSSFLSELRAIDHIFLTWHEGGKPKKEYRLPVSRQQLVRFFEKGVNKTDIGRHVIPELGFAVSLVPTAQFSDIVFRVNCGGYSPWNSNCCSIELPREGDVAERIVQASKLTQIARAVVHSWQPLHGVITSHQCSKIISPENPLRENGWITYLSEQYGDLPRFSSPVEVEKLENGHLIVLTGERFSCGNAAHVKAVKNVAALLGFKSKV